MEKAKQLIELRTTTLTTEISPDLFTVVESTANILELSESELMEWAMLRELFTHEKLARALLYGCFRFSPSLLMFNHAEYSRHNTVTSMWVARFLLFLHDVTSNLTLPERSSNTIDRRSIKKEKKGFWS